MTAQIMLGIRSFKNKVKQVRCKLSECKIWTKSDVNQIAKRMQNLYQVKGKANSQANAKFVPIQDQARCKAQVRGKAHGQAKVKFGQSQR